ncbi:MAG: DUF3325 domain-containing protein [Henriciella sp.]|jgi:membrane protein YdbS with pleckstrin-like domain
MTWIIALLIALPGFAALSLSMSKCQRQVFDGPVPNARSKQYRWIGSLAVLALAIWCLITENWSIGLVVFFGVCTIAALIIIFTMSLRPKVVRYYCWIPSERD